MFTLLAARILMEVSRLDLFNPVSTPIGTGERGAQGEKGDKGDTGPAGGAPGATGPVGAPGAPGTPGTNGLRGPTGSTGPTGPAGTPGRDGTPGSNGSAGAAGVNGAPGPVGPRGADGTAGVAGVAGAKGETGNDGLDGLDGADGAIGEPGQAAGIQLTLTTTGITDLTAATIDISITNNGIALVIGQFVTVMSSVSSVTGLITTAASHTEGTLTVFSHAGTTLPVGSHVAIYNVLALPPPPPPDPDADHTVISDRRLKRNVDDDVPGIDFVRELEPKRFKYTPDSGKATDKYHFGLIAQDVESALRAVGVKEDTTSLVVNNDTHMALSLEELHAVLLSAVKNIDSRVAVLEKN